MAENLAREINLQIQEGKWNPHRTSSKKLKANKKSLESILEKNETLPIGENTSNDSRFLTRNHGDRKGVSQYFSSTERKELSTQNPISVKVSFGAKAEIKMWLDWGK